ncbi:MAG TPA: chemotaxis protein CheB [Ideonella sp.]|nr:chemotaxis protein CheB [Ideonella sp.]
MTAPEPAAEPRQRTPAPPETAAAPVEALPAQATPFPVVGIGASAGGLAAFEAFFAAMPPDRDSGMAFVLVQHLAPDHESILVELVKRYTRMQVVEAANGMRVQPDCTYIIPPNHDLELADGALWLQPHAAERKPHLTIDRFFRSLATAQRERAICIVMSGTGSDGSAGLRAVKGEGGLVIAQAPETAEYDGMPRSAIETGLVDYVLAPADMPVHLVTYAGHAFAPERKLPSASTREGFLKRACELLRAQTGHDFSQYKEATLVRRLERRMALHQIAGPDDYLRYARENPQEVESLFHDLLIGVTSFFRDPEAFAAFEQKVVPRLFEARSPQEPLRVWVCACSTGEEAYSITIALHEYMLGLKRPPKLQVFATDIDSPAIEQARAGVFPASIAADVSPERLARYFVHDPQRGTYRIQKHIRDLMVFSEQDVTKDPPFSRLDLISCRNLLIYLNADVQRRLIALFHYSLVPGGVLFLGTSETAGENGRLFGVIDRKWKLFSRTPGEKGEARPTLPDFVLPLADPRDRRPAPHGIALEEPASLRQITEQALLAHYAQAGVLVTGRGQILYISGRTGRFLEPPVGDAAMNILAMAREGLRREMAVALHKAAAQKEPVGYAGLRVRSNGDSITANLVVRPVGAAAAAGLFLVVLEEVPPHEAAPGVAPPDAEQGERIALLERELRAKDEYLQTTLEEMETTNEELKSTNEELQSVNEELQSTNEELETSKEELQSVNEELSTVNTELQEKVADLSRANDDMNNLLAGTGIGTVFVDQDLRIARFTPAATQVINLIDGDVGRPLEHVVSNFVGYGRLVDDVRAVLETLTPREAEVQVKSGAWYLLRIHPYRTMENLIEGAVLTLVDVTEGKRAEEAVRRSEARLNAFFSQTSAGFSETGLDGRLLFVNDRLCSALGYSRDELLRLRLEDITEPQDLPRVRERMQSLVHGGPDLRFDRCYVRKDGTRVTMHERVSAIRDAAGRPTSLLSMSFDLPDRVDA